MVSLSTRNSIGSGQNFAHTLPYDKWIDGLRRVAVYLTYVYTGGIVWRVCTQRYLREWRWWCHNGLESRNFKEIQYFNRHRHPLLKAVYKFECFNPMYYNLYNSVRIKFWRVPMHKFPLNPLHCMYLSWQETGSFGVPAGDQTVSCHLVLYHFVLCHFVL